MSATLTDPLPGPVARTVHPSADRTAWVSAMPFVGAHLVPVAAFFVVVRWYDWLLCGILYAVRMFFITAGYHRYFAHRSYRMGRLPQFIMAVGGTTALQKGPLWWAGHHRRHHRFADTDNDVHSPRDGLWWSHVGWILSTRYKATNTDDIKDFAVFPELRILDRLSGVAPALLAVSCWLAAGWGGLVVGFFLSTVLLWHGTFLVNSMAHVVGRRRFATPDTSRNSLVIALLTGGEGWHNNHHFLPASARQGLFWWEIDVTWYVLRGLAAVGLVRDLKRPPERLLGRARVGNGAFDIGMFRLHWERAAKLTGLLPANRGDASALEEPGAAADGRSPSRLSALMARVLDSADQLAAATRPARDDGTNMGGGPPPGDIPGA